MLVFYHVFWFGSGGRISSDFRLSKVCPSLDCSLPPMEGDTGQRQQMCVANIKMFYSRRCLNFPGSITVFVVVRWILFHAGFYCFREIMIQIKGRQAQDGGHCQRCCRALPASAHLVACLREMGRWCSPPTRRMIEAASVAAADVARMQRLGHISNGCKG